jgi:hypothetical protein
MVFPYSRFWGSSSVRLGGLFFFFFYSISLFPLLLSSRPSRLLFLPCFWFSLFLLTHFSLNAQGRWHAGWLGSVFSMRNGVCVLQQWLLSVLGRDLGFFSFYGFDHHYFSLSLLSSPTLKSGACSWVY